MATTINVFQPCAGQEELNAIQDVFASNWLGEGKRVKEFSTLFTTHLGVKGGYIQALSSCTDGLFLSLQAIGVTCGDDVMLPSISFVGSANAICATGARPIFCDVDRRTLNPSIDDVMRAITMRTKAVIVLHYGGVPCDIVQISDYCKARKLLLIEDSACSIASKMDGRACGTFGDIGVWSFDAMKIITTGDGGMLFTPKQDIARKVRKLAFYGMTQDSGVSSSATNRWWEFDIQEYGRRATMNDIAGAMGIEQMKKLPRFIQQRREHYEHYDQRLSKIGWLSTPPTIAPYVESSYYFYWIQTGNSARDALARHLRENGVYVTMRYLPLHLISAYDSIGHLDGAEAAGRSTLNLPLHQGLSVDDVDYVCDLIREFKP